MAAIKIGLSLLVVALLSTSTFAQARVTITPRKVTLIRPAETVKAFPHKRKAVVAYPVVSGLRDQVVLRRVRAILQFKNIFDYTLKDYRDDPWLEEFGYDVNYNADHILDLTFWQTGSAAYPDTQHHHFTIDLRRGAVVKASDVFLTDKLEQLAGLVNDKLQKELKDSTPEILKGGDITANDLRDLHEALKFEVKNLDDFEVSKDGLVFLYDAGFPHVIQAIEPDGRYRFTYRELKPFLKPDGLLGQFVD